MNNKFVGREREYHREWRELHKESCKKAVKKWKEGHRDKVRVTNKKFRDAHKDRVKNGFLRWRYGTTLDEYNALLAKQGDLCAICGMSMDKPHFDHDHTTNQFRAFLCANCNTALGLIHDDIQIGRSMVKYLLRHSSKKIK